MLMRLSRHRPFGIHHCGTDPHRFATSYAKVPHLDFLDVGWGGDVKAVRATDAQIDAIFATVEELRKGNSCRPFL